MNVDYIKLGKLRCNCYLLEKDGKFLLIDPGEELNKILEFIKEKELIGILVTHYHFDHVDSLEYLVDVYELPVYDFYSLKEGMVNIGPFHMEVIYTPGHTRDLVTYYFPTEKMMFTGDFLFKRAIGRCDLIGSNEEDMQRSIKKIKKYDDDIIVYPGHGSFTSLGDEKEHNPYF